MGAGEPKGAARGMMSGSVNGGRGEVTEVRRGDGSEGVKCVRSVFVSGQLVLQSEWIELKHDKDACV